jgi:hypothetical protein
MTIPFPYCALGIVILNSQDKKLNTPYTYVDIPKLLYSNVIFLADTHTHTTDDTCTHMVTFICIYAIYSCVKSWKTWYDQNMCPE